MSNATTTSPRRYIQECGKGAFVPHASTLYEDQTVALTSTALVLRGATRFLGRTRRVYVADLVTFELKHRAAYPNQQLPRRGKSETGVWFTRDPRRWKRSVAIEIHLKNGESLGFTPAHAGRVEELLTRLGVTPRTA